MKLSSPQAEAKAIANLCNGGTNARTYLLSKLTEDHFDSPPCLSIFERIIELLSQGKDIPSTKMLKDDPTLSDESVEVLRGKQKIIHKKRNMAILVDNLDKYRKVRTLFNGLRAATAILKKINDDDEKTKVDEVDMVLEEVLLESKSGSNDVRLFHGGKGGNMEALFNKIISNKEPDYLKTGFHQFDQRTGGFHRSNLITIAALSGGGKSAMANQFLINFYLNTYNVCLVTFEQDEEETYNRTLANIADVDVNKINLKKWSHKEKARIMKMRDAFDQHGIDNNCRYTIYPALDLDIPTLSMQLKPYKFDVILVDYIGLVKSKKGKGQAESLGDIAKDCKIMAKSQNAVVILFAQLNEEFKVKYSRAIREHSNMLWLWDYAEKEKETHIVEIIQDKARNSPKYNFMLLENFENMAWSDYEGPNPHKDAKKSKKGKNAGAELDYMEDEGDE